MRPSHALEGSWNCVSTGVGFQFSGDNKEVGLGVFEDSTAFVMSAEGGDWAVTSVPEGGADAVVTWSGTYAVEATELSLSIATVSANNSEADFPENHFVIEGIPEDGRGPTTISNSGGKRAFIPTDGGFRIVSSEENYLDCSRA